MNISPANLSVVAHPAAAALLTRLRDKNTEVAEFRRCLDALAHLLVVAALADAATAPEPVETPLGPTEGKRLEPAPGVVPVVRAGLGMLDAALRLLPSAPVGFVGMRRIERGQIVEGGAGSQVVGGSEALGSVSHECYLESLPRVLAGRGVLVLEVMLATGGSAVEVVRLLSAAGASPITLVCALAAPEGVEAVNSSFPDVQIVTAALDSHLNEQAYIVPGLGDAGDRLYGAV